MNILSRRITALRSNTSYQRYFMHMLFGGSNFQFYEPMSSKQGVVKHTNVRFFSSDSVNRHANYYWDDDKEEIGYDGETGTKDKNTLPDSLGYDDIKSWHKSYTNGPPITSIMALIAREVKKERKRIVDLLKNLEEEDNNEN